jgi:hypothetical protein
MVRAETVDLQVDTIGSERAVDVQTEGLQVLETCAKNIARYTGRATGIWRITVPRDIDLDLVAVGGAIVAGNVDGDVVLRTGGGPIRAGSIGGNAVMETLGGAIHCGNIWGRADLRNPGTIEVGDIGGIAHLHTTAGRITTGNIAGSRIEAEAGSTIAIGRAREVKAVTTAGDILIVEGEAVSARSGGGHITVKRARGPFQAHTEHGDIRLDRADSSIEASTGQGNILVHMLPSNLDIVRQNRDPQELNFRKARSEWFRRPERCARSRH